MTLFSFLSVRASEITVDMQIVYFANANKHKFDATDKRARTHTHTHIEMSFPSTLAVHVQFVVIRFLLLFASSPYQKKLAMIVVRRLVQCNEAKREEKRTLAQ